MDRKYLCVCSLYLYNVGCPDNIKKHKRIDRCQSFCSFVIIHHYTQIKSQ